MIGFALLGAAFIALIVYVYANWIIGGHAHASPTGRTVVLGSMKFEAVFWQVTLGLISLGLFLGFVVQPLRRDRRLHLYGMLYIGSQLMWWQDSFLNYLRPVFTYTSALWNKGSWNGGVPGWVSPNGYKMPSPVFLYLGLYPVFFCGATVLVVSLMHKAKRRWPQLGPVRLVATMFVALGVFAVLAEGAWLRTGLYSYTGVWSPVTLWPSQAGKVPVLQVFFLDSMVLTSLASLIYFRDDRGLTVVERGIERVQVGSRRRTLLRLLAVVGMCNAILFVFYNIPTQWEAMLGPGWAKSVASKSYFTNGVCGPGTTYACPGRRIPVALGNDSIHISPSGTLVVPNR